MTYLWVWFTLISHWRRKPFQGAMIVVSLAMATALFSGVQALNLQARSNYAEATRLLGGDQYPVITARNGARFSDTVFARLRRAGWQVSPVLDGRISIDGRSYRLLGIDIVSLPRGPIVAPLGTDARRNGFDLAAFLTTPGQTLGAPVTVANLGGVNTQPNLDGETSSLRSLPPLFAVADIPPATLLVDIGLAQSLLSAPREISSLILNDPRRSETGALRVLLEEAFAGITFDITPPGETAELTALTESFHLNLSAFGWLAFGVGLLITYSAITLAYEQRRGVVRTLRACGASRHQVTRMLMVELLSLAAIAGLLGMLLGYGMAGALLPNVALTLRGLYGVAVADSLTFSPYWWALGLVISMGGALLAAGYQLYRLRHVPIMRLAVPRRPAGTTSHVRYWSLFGVIMCTILAAGTLGLGTSLLSGFLLIGLVFLGAALALPALANAILSTGERAAAQGNRSNSPLPAWFWADTRQQLPGLTVALQALMIALAVNIGVGAMVSSFRTTFETWLDQRFAADLYISAPPVDEVETEAFFIWLQGQPQAETVLPLSFESTRLNELSLSLFGFTPDPLYQQNWPLLEQLPGAWRTVETGKAILINEQLSYAAQLGPGDTVDLQTPTGDWTVPIAGIYADYGNTRGQIMMDINTLRKRWQSKPPTRFAVKTAPNTGENLTADLIERFDLAPGRVVDQVSLKRFSKRIFERTFAVTSALNILTFMVAGIALFTNLLALAGARLPQLAPVWALGMTRHKLARLEQLKTLALALVAASAALPLGLCLAWILTDIINVRAFGWRLPFQIFPGQIIALGGLAAATGWLAGLLPSIQLARRAPADLLKVFSNER